MQDPMSLRGLWKEISAQDMAHGTGTIPSGPENPNVMKDANLMNSAFISVYGWFF